MGKNRNVAATVQDHLTTVAQAVGKIQDPSTGKPVTIPDYAALQKAAGRLDAIAAPTDAIYVIQALLSRASNVDFAAPDETYPLAFPADHHLHATMGPEWYWVGAHLKVTDSAGKSGRAAIMLSMQRTRSVGLAAQKKAGWTDAETTLATNVVTVTIDMGPGERRIVRRSRNLQWPMKGGSLSYSTPGQDFSFTCGRDSLRGSKNVLPLDVVVDDGANMKFKLTLTNGDFVNLENSFFRQGVPIIGGNGGSGLTPVPTPGIYYSWPQLTVGKTSLTVQGKTYTVNSGVGWMDHQLMMSSLQNAKGAVHPVPFVEDPRPYNGWVWQYYNLDKSHQAFTGAGFILGEMNMRPAMDYGYFLTPDGKGRWTAIFINGQIDLLYPEAFPTIAGSSKPGPTVTIPIVRAYTGVENILLGDPLSGVATPWHRDGMFNNANWSPCAEIPADYTDMSGRYSDGVGFLEGVSLEPIAAYRKFALAFLATGKTTLAMARKTVSKSKTAKRRTVAKKKKRL